MSSMRNAVQRRNHRERAQPLERQKLGLLEKKKDYQLRARDYSAKKAKLKLMQEKAVNRNPDEFHYSMINARSKGGIVIGDRGNESLSNAAVALLKTQDANYMRLKLAEEQHKIEKLEGELSFMDIATDKAVKKSHTVFVDSVKEAKDFDPAEHFDTPEQLLNRTFNRPRKEQLESGAFIDEAVEAIGRGRLEKKIQKQRNARYKELEARLERAEELRRVEEELQLQRAKMAGGKRNGNKWAKVRKR